MEERTTRVIFGKNGTGSTTNKVTIPVPWIKALGITEEERNVIISFDGDSIVIQKIK